MFKTIGKSIIEKLSMLQSGTIGHLSFNYFSVFPQNTETSAQADFAEKGKLAIVKTWIKKLEPVLNCYI